MIITRPQTRLVKFDSIDFVGHIYYIADKYCTNCILGVRIRLELNRDDLIYCRGREPAFLELMELKTIHHILGW